MKKSLLHLAAFALAWSLTAASSTMAQGIAVHDTQSYLKLIDQVKAAEAQLQTLEKAYNQAVDTYNEFHGLTSVNGVAPILNSDASKKWLPDGARDIEQLMAAGNTNLGALGQAAANIRAGRRVNLPTLSGSASVADKASRAALEASGDAAAKNAAIADAAYGATTTRSAGLDQLQQALEAATTDKERQAIQARIGIEQARIQNDAMQLEAVKMRQAAEDRLTGQATRENYSAKMTGGNTAGRTQ